MWWCNDRSSRLSREHDETVEEEDADDEGNEPPPKSTTPTVLPLWRRCGTGMVVVAVVSASDSDINEHDAGLLPQDEGLQLGVVAGAGGGAGDVDTSTDYFFFNF